MSIPANKIINVFLSENKGSIDPEDQKILRNYDMWAIYRIVNSENLSEEEQNVLNLFNKYYKNEYKREDNE
jgi:hypothetical protein